MAETTTPVVIFAKVTQKLPKLAKSKKNPQNWQ
jgi:hypothetical protein